MQPSFNCVIAVQQLLQSLFSTSQRVPACIVCTWSVFVQVYKILKRRIYNFAMRNRMRPQTLSLIGFSFEMLTDFLLCLCTAVDLLCLCTAVDQPVSTRIGQSSCSCLGDPTTLEYKLPREFGRDLPLRLATHGNSFFATAEEGRSSFLYPPSTVSTAISSHFFSFVFSQDLGLIHWCVKPNFTWSACSAFSVIKRCWKWGGLRIDS